MLSEMPDSSLLRLRLWQLVLRLPRLLQQMHRPWLVLLHCVPHQRYHSLLSALWHDHLRRQLSRWRIRKSHFAFVSALRLQLRHLQRDFQELHQLLLSERVLCVPVPEYLYPGLPRRLLQRPIHKGVRAVCRRLCHLHWQHCVRLPELRQLHQLDPQHNILQGHRRHHLLHNLPPRTVHWQFYPIFLSAVLFSVPSLLKYFDYLYIFYWLQPRILLLQ